MVWALGGPVVFEVRWAQSKAVWKETMTLIFILRFCLGLVMSAGVATAASATLPGGKLGVALYGSNGHQLRPDKFDLYPQATLVAVAGLKPSALPEGVKRYTTLDEIIADPAVAIVILCSPRRADQARDAIRCLDGRKHVYAEKPSALTEVELDSILAAAQRAGREFREMAGTAFAANYAAMRQLVQEGAVGDVVQILVQKSYRYGSSRPQDEAIDGGLFLQAGIHAARLVEHVGGVRMTEATAWETSFGKPDRERGAGKIAAAAHAPLANGGMATIIINYLNPARTSLPHGNETLRIFGTKGFIESVDGGTRTRLVTSEKVVEPLDRAPGPDYFNAFVTHLVTGAAMPLSVEEELHPLRVLLRAKAKLR